LLYGKSGEDGCFLSKHRRLRKGWKCILKWEKLGVDVLKTILVRGGSIYLNLLRYGEILLFWYNELGEHFQTMMCNGLACRLSDDEIMVRLYFWHNLLGLRF
jgi:hypothetical protein